MMLPVAVAAAAIKTRASLLMSSSYSNYLSLMVELIVAAAAVSLHDRFVAIVVYLVAPSDCH